MRGRAGPATPTARRRAVETLRGVLEKGRNAAPLVGELAKGLSPADQDLLRELALGALRWKFALDAEIAGACRIPLEKLAPNLREIMEVALYQLRHLDRIPPYAAVSEAVDQARASGGEGASRLINGVLRKILLGAAPAPPRESGIGNRESEELARFYSHPPFLVERWLERFGGARTRAILEADNKSPGLDLLVNPRRTSRDALGAALAEEGIATEASAIAPLALTVLSGNPLRSRLLAEGHFSVQDIGSQLLPLLLPEGELLVDLAAAPGGKSLSALAHGRFGAARIADQEQIQLPGLGPMLPLLHQAARPRQHRQQQRADAEHGAQTQRERRAEDRQRDEGQQRQQAGRSGERQRGLAHAGDGRGRIHVDRCDAPAGDLGG